MATHMAQNRLRPAAPITRDLSRCGRRAAVVRGRALSRRRAFDVTIHARPWRAAALLARLDRCDRAGGVQLGAQCRRQ